MTVRPWSGAEVYRAIAWCRAGMSVAEIATALRRSKSGVYNQLGRQGVWQRHQRPGVTQPVAEGDHERARRLLALEVVRAQAERATAPLYRHWPQGTWP
jgi:IS30 family transposase